MELVNFLSFRVLLFNKSVLHRSPIGKVPFPSKPLRNCINFSSRIDCLISLHPGKIRQSYSSTRDSSYVISGRIANPSSDLTDFYPQNHGFSCANPQRNSETQISNFLKVDSDIQQVLFSDFIFSPFKSLNSFTFALDLCTEKTPFFKIFQRINSAVTPDADVLKCTMKHIHTIQCRSPVKKGRK